MYNEFVIFLEDYTGSSLGEKCGMMVHLRHGKWVGVFTAERNFNNTRIVQYIRYIPSGTVYLQCPQKNFHKWEVVREWLMKELRFELDLEA